MPLVLPMARIICSLSRKTQKLKERVVDVFLCRTGAGTERIADMDLPGMATYLDWINVMTYDFHGESPLNPTAIRSITISNRQVAGKRRLVTMLHCT